MRPTPLSRQVEDLWSELELLRSAQERLFNVARLQASLAHYGLKVLGYEGPARYELSRVVQYELYGELPDVTTLSMSSTFGARPGGLGTGTCTRSTSSG